MICRLFLRGTCAAVALFAAGVSTVAQDSYPAAKQIVSVGGSITEIIYALGEQDRLVARDTTSNYPATALDLPDIGYMRRLSPEGILSVNPDLIIAEEGSGPMETIELLNGVEIPFVTIPEGFDRDAIITKINMVAEVLGVPERGAVLAAKINEDLQKSELAASQNTSNKRVLFILTMSNDRFLVSGTNTGADGIIRMAGGRNAITEFEGYKPVPMRRFQRRCPILSC